MTLVILMFHYTDLKLFFLSIKTCFLLEALGNVTSGKNKNIPNWNNHHRIQNACSLRPRLKATSQEGSSFHVRILYLIFSKGTKVAVQLSVLRQPHSNFIKLQHRGVLFSITFLKLSQRRSNVTERTFLKHLWVLIYDSGEFERIRGFSRYTKCRGKLPDGW